MIEIVDEIAANLAAALPGIDPAVVSAAAETLVADFSVHFEYGITTPGIDGIVGQTKDLSTWNDVDEKVLNHTVRRLASDWTPFKYERLGF